MLLRKREREREIEPKGITMMAWREEIEGRDEIIF